MKASKVQIKEDSLRRKSTSLRKTQFWDYIKQGDPEFKEKNIFENVMIATTDGGRVTRGTKVKVEIGDPKVTDPTDPPFLKKKKKKLDTAKSTYHSICLFL